MINAGSTSKVTNCVSEGAYIFAREAENDVFPE
jgi:hypothetical protein